MKKLVLGIGATFLVAIGIGVGLLLGPIQAHARYAAFSLTVSGTNARVQEQPTPTIGQPDVPTRLTPSIVRGRDRIFRGLHTAWAGNPHVAYEVGAFWFQVYPQGEGTFALRQAVVAAAMPVVTIFPAGSSPASGTPSGNSFEHLRSGVWYCLRVDGPRQTFRVKITWSHHSPQIWRHSARYLKQEVTGVLREWWTRMFHSGAEAL